MKIKLWMLAVILATAALAHGATNELTGLLQKGLFEEEANRDLSAAISNYQSLANAFDKDRELAATAIFRLGECYRKLGRTNDAVVQYQRIVHEFSDQQTLVTLSEQNLAGLHALNPSPKTAERQNPSETSQQARQLIVEAEAQFAKNQTLMKTLWAMDGNSLRNALPGIVPDTQLDSLEAQLDQAQQEFTRLKGDYASDHPKVQNAAQVMKDLRSKIDDRIGGILIGLQAKLNSSKAYLDTLKAQLGEAQASNQTIARGSASGEQAPTTTDEEDTEIRRIQAMIQNSPDLINAPDHPPLLLAAAKGQLVVAKYLLDHGAAVNGMKLDQEPLNAAAENGHKAMVELLLARGADANGGGYNPLYRAIEHGYTGVAEALLANKADVNLRTEAGRRPLNVAASLGRTDLIPLLIKHGADVNATDDHGLTPLHEVAGPGEAKLLLASKAIIDARTQQGNTPLHLAAQAGKTEVVSFLIDSGANVDATNSYNATPLSYAVSNKRVDAARVLLEHKADPNLRDFGGATVLFRSTDPEIARLLIAHGADINARDRNGGTPLIRTVNTNYLRFLIEAGANIDLQETNGNTALHYAVFNERSEFVNILLEHHAKPNIQNDPGFTPLDIAQIGQSGRMSDSMITQKSSAIHGVSKENEDKIAELLIKAGGLANLPKRDRIQLQRGANSNSGSVFFKGSHDWNRFSLIEFVAAQEGLLSTAQSGEWYMRPGDNSSLWEDTLRFPDLKKIIIHRRTSDNAKQPTSAVNVEAILAAGDCSRDVWLEWGDVVEIPEADHPVDEKWEGPSAATIQALTNCLARQVTIKIKGESTLLKLAPALVPIQVTIGDMAYSKKKLIRPSFMLRSVLDNSKLLRVSSDLSRVKVTRRDPATKKAVDLVVDCSPPEPADFWLRDGDVVEVPER